MATRLGVPGLQPLQDLFTIPFYELPRGNKKKEAENRCRHWIETAASVVFATAIFFVDLSVSRVIHRHVSGYKAQILDTMLSFTLIYASYLFDDRSAHITAIFNNIYHIKQAIHNQDILHGFMCGYHLRVNCIEFNPMRTGFFYPSIHRFAQSWAPTMVRLYRYR